MRLFISLLFLFSFLNAIAQSSRVESTTPSCCLQRDYISDFEQVILRDFQKGNTVSNSSLLFAIDSSMTLRKFGLTDKYFKEFCAKLKNRRVQFQTDISYLKHIFDVVQQYYLKEFKYNQSVDRTMYKGQFDCVSGTAFYALVLENIDYHFVIKETPLHVYMEVLADGNKILFETTDKNGFIINVDRVEKLEIQYAYETSDDYADLIKRSGGVQTGKLDKEINMIQLAGLQYFNKSTVAYSNGNYHQSLLFAQKAFLLYPSSRIKGLIVLALEGLMNSKEISYKTKLEMYKKYRS